MMMHYSRHVGNPQCEQGSLDPFHPRPSDWIPALMGDGLHGCFVHRPWVTGDVAALCFDRAATTLTLKHRRLCRVYVMDSIGALAPCPEGTLACARAPPFARDVGLALLPFECAHGATNRAAVAA